MSKKDEKESMYPAKSNNIIWRGDQINEQLRQLETQWLNRLTS